MSNNLFCQPSNNRKIFFFTPRLFALKSFALEFFWFLDTTQSARLSFEMVLQKIIVLKDLYARPVKVSKEPSTISLFLLSAFLPALSATDEQVSKSISQRKLTLLRLALTAL